MDYIEGESLSDIVKREGAMDENRATYYIKKVGEALEYIHSQNMTHFDVKPANIMVRKNDDFSILIDFGLSKQYNESGEATTTGLTGVSKGFSAIELTNLSEVTTFSEQSDVYSLGATLLYLLTGTMPPDASALVSGSEELTFQDGMSDNLKKAITSAMEVNRKKRCKNVKEFLEIIDCGNTSGKSTFVPSSEVSEYSIPPSSDGDNEDTHYIDVKPENYHNSTSAYSSDSSYSDESKKEDLPDRSINDTDTNSISWWTVTIVIIIIISVWGLIESSKPREGALMDTLDTDTMVSVEEDIIDDPTHFVQDELIYNEKGLLGRFCGKLDQTYQPDADGILYYSENDQDGRENFEGTLIKGNKTNGTLTYKDGSYYKGTFYNDTFYNGVFYDAVDSSTTKFVNGKQY